MTYSKILKFKNDKQIDKIATNSEFFTKNLKSF